ncbi:MAG: hypothetical protein HOP02_02160 [Methylococcaceae bacterium]|nr:hypothetical protein [Methylococcaceae bacterium]
MNKQQISTSTNCVTMALVSCLTTTGVIPNHLWALPNQGILDIDVPASLGIITNYLPVQKTESSLTIPDVIMQAQNILGISKQHLTFVFDTSRQNLYNLLNNNEQVPKSETVARAIQVKQALDIIAEICPHKLGASTMTCRIDGRRLFDELIAREINLAQVKVFAQEINKRISTQQQSNIPESVIRNQEFIDTFNAA